MWHLSMMQIAWNKGWRLYSGDRVCFPMGALTMLCFALVAGKVCLITHQFGSG